MKAKINHGRAGRQLPPKDYGSESWVDLMVEAYINGNRDDAIGYFNRMKEYDQKSFLMFGYLDYMCGKEVKNLIIRNL